MLGRAWRRAGLGARLFVAIGLVILAGAATALLVAVLVAPPVFRHHLESVGVTADSPVASHIDRGFTIALLTAVAAAVVAASAVAALVAVVVARRISRPVGTAAAAAGRLADGDYSTRVQPPAMGPELDELARSVNALAVRLESAERRRLDLMTDLAHELRTPLATLEATVEALVDGVLPLDRTTLQTLTDQTGRLTRLTHDLPAVSDEHAFRLDRRDADLGALVATAVSTHQARYDAAGVTLTSDAPDALATRVDPDRVLEVLDQLLDNALRHTDALVVRSPSRCDATATAHSSGSPTPVRGSTRTPPRRSSSASSGTAVEGDRGRADHRPLPRRGPRRHADRRQPRPLGGARSSPSCCPSPTRPAPADPGVRHGTRAS